MSQTILKVRSTSLVSHMGTRRWDTSWNTLWIISACEPTCRSKVGLLKVWRHCLIFFQNIPLLLLMIYCTIWHLTFVTTRHPFPKYRNRFAQTCLGSNLNSWIKGVPFHRGVRTTWEKEGALHDTWLRSQFMGIKYKRQSPCASWGQSEGTHAWQLI